MYSRRAPWREIWMDVATAVSRRSSCMRDKVGAVVVYDDIHTYIGFNGPEAGKTNCDQGGCPRGSMSLSAQPRGGDYANCTAVHAEVNAVRKFLDAGMIVDAKATIYITREPCEGCWDFLYMKGFINPQVVWSR